MYVRVFVENAVKFHENNYFIFYYNNITHRVHENWLSVIILKKLGIFFNLNFYLFNKLTIC